MSNEHELTSPCVIWPGYIDPDGYGRTRNSRAAHRAVWEAVNGPIPSGLTIDHRCFVTTCVNVEHMRLLTNLENAQNQRSALKTHCVNGHEFTPENSYVRPRKYRGGRRDCRACNRAAVARYQQRKSA